MNFPHWSSRLNFFLCFYYSLIFFYYFPPLLALCMEIRVWIFSSRLPASDCRKEKKKTGNRSLARYYYCDVVCMLVVESYIILFRFFPFLVLLYSNSSRNDAAAVLSVYGIVMPLQLIVVFLLSFSRRVISKWCWWHMFYYIFLPFCRGKLFDNSLFCPMYVNIKTY